jgi:hypothetical protein
MTCARYPGDAANPDVRLGNLVRHFKFLRVSVTILISATHLLAASAVPMHISDPAGHRIERGLTYLQNSAHL